MTEAHLKVVYREDKGKHAAKTLRNAGRIPAVFYSHHDDSVALSVDNNDIEKLIHTEVNIIDVSFPDGKEKKCIIKEIQRDPVSENLVHVDIMGIDLKEKVRMTIPVIFTGTPVGVKDEAGILEHTVRELELEGLPMEIPEHIEIDVSQLHLGQGVVVEDIEIGDNLTIHADPTQSVAHVVMPKVTKTAVEEIEEEGIEEEGAEEEGEEESAETEE